MYCLLFYLTFLMHDFLIRWFKESDIQLGSFAHHNMSVYANEFEDMSYESIIPVHVIHSPIAIKISHLTNINIITNLAQTLFF